MLWYKGKILQYTKRVGSNDFETSIQSQNRIIEKISFESVHTTHGSMLLSFEFSAFRRDVV